MADIIPFPTFRALRACRRIQDSSDEILENLDRLRVDTQRASTTLTEAGRRLEQTLSLFSQARARLEQSVVEHHSLMILVDAIRAESPAFADLRDPPRP